MNNAHVNHSSQSNSSIWDVEVKHKWSQLPSSRSKPKVLDLKGLKKNSEGQREMNHRILRNVRLYFLTTN